MLLSYRPEAIFLCPDGGRERPSPRRGAARLHPRHQDLQAEAGGQRGRHLQGVVRGPGQPAARDILVQGRAAHRRARPLQEGQVHRRVRRHGHRRQRSLHLQVGHLRHHVLCMVKKRAFPRLRDTVTWRELTQPRKGHLLDLNQGQILNES